MIKKLSIILLLILITSCTPTEKACTADLDCAPSACCHPNDAVNKQNAPDCRGVLCTLECTPETLDCGQGQLKCISGECKVVLK